MLTVLNNYAHGLTAIPTFFSLKKHSLFEYLKTNQPCEFNELINALHANPGHFKTALTLCDAIGLIEGMDDEAITLNTEHCFFNLPDELTELYAFDYQTYLTQPSLKLSLAPWIEKIKQRWHIDEEFAMYADGFVLVPLLLNLRNLGWLEVNSAQQTLSFLEQDFSARQEVIDVFADRGWLVNADAHFTVSGTGEFIAQRIFITATVAAYMPMFRQLDTILFGDCQAVFARDEQGHERHINRALNVLGSGFQHQKYFSDLEQIIVKLFNEQPLAEQPRYIADMGCGDGKLLQKIFTVIKEKTRRGQQLPQYPLLLIGLDYNEQSLRETETTLQGLPFVTLKADIGAPEAIPPLLAAHGIQDPENILHVRSFLDHDRPWIDSEQTPCRYAKVAKGVFTRPDGQLISPTDAWQSLNEHLARWANLPSRFGLLLLEVHCLSAQTIRQFRALTESLNFDAYHRYSLQYLQEAADFIAAAANNGLIPEPSMARQYPRVQPFSRITLNYFRRRDWQFRIAEPTDLVQLEAAHWHTRQGEHQGAFLQGVALARRLAEFPNGQWVAVKNNRIVAAVLAQRCDEENKQTGAWQHQPQGSVAELQAVCLMDSSAQEIAQALVSFVAGYQSLLSGVESVIGEQACLAGLATSQTGFVVQNDSANTCAPVEGLEDGLQQLVAQAALGVDDDDARPEQMLNQFCYRQLLVALQTLGAFVEPEVVYPMADQLHVQLGILPKYDRLFHFFMALLERNSLVQKTQEGFLLKTTSPAPKDNDWVKSSDDFQREFRRRFPAYENFLTFVLPTLRHLPEILTGKIEANDVMFPQGAFSNFSCLFLGNPVADYFNDLGAETIRTFVEAQVQATPQKTIRILEIGAGTGGYTQAILPVLQPFSAHLDYCYSDISSSFTRYGKRRFSEEYTFLSYRRFNFEQPLSTQGFSEEMFDVVCAANVLHNSTYIVDSLARLKQLLKPGGLVVLNEFTAIKDYLCFSGGFLHGYLLYQDEERRLPNTCLMSAPAWETAFADAGFDRVLSLGLPFIHSPEAFRQSQVLAFKPTQKIGQPTTAEKTAAETKQEQPLPLPSENPVMTQTAQHSIEPILTDILISILGEERAQRIEADTPFMSAGIDSIEILEIRTLLGRKLSCELSAPFLFEHNTRNKVIQHFAANAPQPKASAESNTATPSESITPVRNNTETVLNATVSNTTTSVTAESTAPLPSQQSQKEGQAIAITGIALRFPGECNSADEFWAFLNGGQDAIRRIGNERWQWPENIDINGADKGIDYGAFLKDIATFDPAFFKMTPAEAELLDPQQRLLLELSWHALENAGYAPCSLRGGNVGVFIGACHFDYRELLEKHAPSHEPLLATSSHGSLLANRLSFFYDWHGPSVMVDSACSSSLLAVHQAVNSLRHNECQVAMVGGVNLMCSPSNTLSFYQAGMLASDGRCKTFDAQADGYVRGEGGAALVLKTLAQAEQDGDFIHGVIRGSAVNHGGQASSLTAPSPAAQAQLIEQAYRQAGVSPLSVGLIETHGTGTALGDPIEVDGLQRAFRQLLSEQPSQPNTPWCALGSVKSNIGHLEGAAGIAGLIKAVLCLQHQQIPKNLNFTQRNPHIPWAAQSPFFLADQPQAWPPSPALNALPCAGVSSFGFGGSNAHVVLEQYPVSRTVETTATASPQLLVLSAKTAAQLQQYASRLLQQLQREPDTDIAALAWSLQTTREPMAHRLACVVERIDDACDALAQFVETGKENPPLLLGQRNNDQPSNRYGDDDVTVLLQYWLSQHRLDKLARFWVDGGTFDWTLIWPAIKPARLPLPNYPFAQNRYWLTPLSATEQTVSAPPILANEEADATLPATVADLYQREQQVEPLLLKFLWATLRDMKLMTDTTPITLSGTLPGHHQQWLEESVRLLQTQPAPFTQTSLEQLWAQWRLFKAESEPAQQARLTLVEATLHALPEILLGRTRATDILFPGGSMALTEGIYKGNDRVDYFNRALSEQVSRYLQQCRTENPEATFRLLEIGAGTGGTTALLLPHLTPLHEHIQEYAYTDLSHAFLAHARQHFAPGHPWLRTERFDVSRPLSEQNITPGSYDVAVATNVLHATADLRTALSHAKAALRPGGLLILNEQIRNDLFTHLTFGLTEGWWLHQDADLRATGCPLLPSDRWLTLLREAGFDVHPAITNGEAAGHQVLVAISDGVIRPQSKPAVATVTPAIATMTPAIATVTSATPAKSPTVEAADIIDIIKQQLAVTLKVDTADLDTNEPFADYGVDSISGVRMITQLNQALQLDLETTALFEFNTISRLAREIMARHPLQAEATAPAIEEPASFVAQASVQPTQAASTQKTIPEPIAIIGMSGQFPQSDTLEDFWTHIAAGHDLVRPVTRWDLAAYYQRTSNKAEHCFEGGLLDSIADFDPLFFRISGTEAKHMDPQQRLFLEQSWLALEDAGYLGESLKGDRCGIYAGCITGDYSRLLPEQRPAQAFWGNACSALAARIAYHLNIQGPAMAIDTACSSSLVAVHMACQALWQGEVDMALAGGVYLQCTPYSYYTQADQAGMLSATGRCHTFDRNADGFVPGEGVGVVVLKSLSQAQADGDHILGVIRASGVNQDGSTNGLTAPNAASQESLLSQIYRRFDIQPDSIQMVEAHGTGTSLGDPIEFSALTRAFRQFTDRKQYCAIGSVKTNIGHTGAAAGISGLLKLLLALRHQQMPPSLHFKNGNEAIDFTNSPFFVNTQLREWQAQGPRRGVVSAFGFSGTNAHLVVEEPPAKVRTTVHRPGWLITLSAQTTVQLQQQAQRLLSVCQRHPNTDLHALSFTLLCGRAHQAKRLAFVTTDQTQLVSQLQQWLTNPTTPADLPSDTAWLEEQKRPEADAILQQDWGQLPEGRYRDQLQALANLYLQGYQGGFARLFNGQGQRISLPGYPFARQRYWIDNAPAPDGNDHSGNKDASRRPFTNTVTNMTAAKAHSMLHSAEYTANGYRFVSHFSGEEFWLRDHLVQGRRVLPGAAYLEIARAAIEQACHDASPCQLTHCVWLQPMVADANGLDIEVLIVPEGHRWRCEITQQTKAESRLCYRCYGERISNQPPASLNLTRLRQTTQTTWDQPTCQQQINALEVTNGPSFKALQSLSIGSEYVIGELTLPEAADALSDFVLHPSLLDAALQTEIGMVGDNNTTRLPFALNQIQYWQPCLEQMTVVIQHSEDNEPGGHVAKYDLHLCNAHGEICISLRGYSCRTLTTTLPMATAAVEEQASHSSSPMRMNMEPEGHPSENSVMRNNAPTTDNLSVFAPCWEATSPLLDDRLANATQKVLRVGGSPAQQQAVLDRFPQHQCLDLTDLTEEQISQKLASLQGLDQVIWFAPASTTHFMVDDPALVEEQENGIIPLFRLLRALTKTVKQAPLALTIITEDTQAVAINDGQCLAHSGIVGLIGSVAKELPYWQFRLVDLAANLSSLPDELFSLPFDAEGKAWAYRDRCWYQQELLPVQQLHGQGDDYVSGGIYVVIGGAGGIAKAWSQWLVEHYQAQIIWLGRSALNPTIQQGLDAIGQIGPKPLYIQADATSLTDLQAAANQIKTRFGQVHGLVHSAIVLRDKSLVNLNEADFRTAYAAKVDTSVYMAHAFKDCQVQQVVFFSSLQSFTQLPGQSNYAAGCLFKDAFATHLKQQWGCTTKIVNWGYWGSVGIVADEFYQQRIRKLGLDSIAPEQGFQALRALLVSPIPQATLLKIIGEPNLPSLNFSRILSQTLTLYPPARLPSVSMPEPVTLPSALVHIEQKGLEIEPLLLQLIWAILRELQLVTQDDRIRPVGQMPAFYEPWRQESLRQLQAKRDLLQPWTSEQLFQQWESTKAQAMTDPNQQARIRLIDTTLQALPDILTGRIKATEVLFPNASMALLEGVYKGNQRVDYYNQVLGDVILHYLQQHRQQHLQQPGPFTSGIRLLEIGAGTGGTTAGLLPQLKPWHNTIEEYCYTDLSRAFLLHAQEHYAEGHPWLRTELFDVSKPVHEQPIAPGHYDVVVATNVLHATPNLRESLRNAKALLRKNGLLVLNEVVGNNLFSHLTLGLTEGWWLPEDKALRIEGSPFLTPESWLAILKSEGFTAMTAIQQGELAGQQVFVAISDGIVRQRRPFDAHAEPMTPVQEPVALTTPNASTPVAIKQSQTTISSQNTTSSQTTTSSVSRPPESGALVTLEQAVDDIIRLVAPILGLPPEQLEARKPLQHYGIDSILVAQLTEELRKVFPDITTTLFFQEKNLEGVAKSLMAKHSDILSARLTEKMDLATSSLLRKEKVVNADTVNTPRIAVEPSLSATSDSVSESTDDIAIIGLSGRFPEADNIDQFWQNLKNARQCIKEIPSERWDWRPTFNEERAKPGHSYSRWGGFINDADKFDPLFFQISPLEAEAMDPQERVFLEAAHACIEDAGYAPDNLTESRQVGVFVGVMNQTYSHTATHWSIANRVSYALDLQGPSLAIDSACSSSLSAVHLAVESLKRGECECAMAGGVNLVLSAEHYVGLSQMGVLASHDQCKAFGDGADGFVDAEAVVALLLKPLAKAQTDGDAIYGVIKGSAINAGGHTHGYTVPNPAAQQAVVANAMRQAQVDPRTVSYLEAHGTGTALGDPLEISALTNAYEQLVTSSGNDISLADGNPVRCALGSVKSNLGHAESAAGLVGLTKILLQFQHQQRVPTLHTESVNPEIHFEQTPFTLQRTLEDWARPTLNMNGQLTEVPRRAGVSSFGAGGANAHLVLEEYSDTQSVTEHASTCLIPLSAMNEARLMEYVQRLQTFIERTGGSFSLANLAYTYQTGRPALPYRLIFVVESLNELASALQATLTKQASDKVIRKQGTAVSAPVVAAPNINADPRRLLAQQWVNGGVVDWHQLYGKQPPKRIHAPGYPFARERYWRKPEQSSSNLSAALAPEERPVFNAEPTNLADSTDLKTKLVHQLTALFGRVIKLAPEKIDRDDTFDQFGIDSIVVNLINRELKATFTDIPNTLLFEYNTIGKLADGLLAEQPQAAAHWCGLADDAQQTDEPRSEDVTVQKAGTHTSMVQTPADPDQSPEPIAIVGLSALYPDAHNQQEFWQRLSEAHCAVTDIPDDRWDWRAHFTTEIATGEPANSYSKWGAFIKDAYLFDPLFFNIPPREAADIDPQERLFLQQAWRALEDAGYDPERFSDTLRAHTGVFAGITKQGYQLFSQAADQALPTTSFASVANRVSYQLNLQGPSKTIDTMCSSSLVALHEACQYLRSGGGRLAIVGGVNLYLHPMNYAQMARSQVLADSDFSLFTPQGRGFVPGEGVGAVILKPYQAALADGDDIYALIRGSAVNHNGRTNAYMASNPQGQAAVIRQALADAKLSAQDIDYLELAASGSELGDSIELRALAQVFADNDPQSTRYRMGSLKGNFGHGEAASGMAQLTKVLLSMKHGRFAPTLLPKQLSTEIPFAAVPYQLQTESEAWPESVQDNSTVPRRAGVTALGGGGVNAHVILEQQPPLVTSQTAGPVVIVLSAKNHERLQALVSDWLVFLAQTKDLDLARAAYTLQVGRAQMPVRLAVIVDHVEQLVRQLRDWKAGHTSSRCKSGDVRDNVRKPVADDLRISGALAELDLETLAEQWVHGQSIDWQALYHSPISRLSGLPVYPFARKLCRPLATMVNQQTPEVVPAKQTDTPTYENKAAEFYSVVADDYASHTSEEYLTLCPFSERLPGFSMTAYFCDEPFHKRWQPYVVTRQIELRQVLFFKEPFEKYQRVLDFGCGHGTDVIQLAAQFPHLHTHGFTITKNQALLGNQRIAERQLNSRAQIFHKNSGKDPFPSQYDLIFGIEVSFHIRDKDGLFSNIQNALKEGGRVLLMDYIAHLSGAIVDPAVEISVPTQAQWPPLLAKYGLLIDEVIDVSPEIANFVYDPDCDKNTAHLDKVSQDSFRNFTNQATSLSRGWVSYVLLKLQKNSALSEAELCAENIARLSSPTPYANAVAEMQAINPPNVYPVQKKRIPPAPTLHVMSENRAEHSVVKPQPITQATPALAQTGDVAQQLKAIFSATLGYSSVELQQLAFSELGISSINAVELTQRINEQFALQLPTSILFEAENMQALVRLIAERLPPQEEWQTKAPASTSSQPIEPGDNQHLAAQPVSAASATTSATTENHDIAVVGLACRCAGADNAEQFWQLVSTGSISTTDIERTDWLDFFDKNSAQPVPAHYGYMTRAETFDPAFFGISPKEAKAMHVSQRVLLETSYHALEDAGYAPGQLSEQKVGSFFGAMNNSASQENDFSHYGMLGTENSILSSRLAFFLNLKGPALTINTACSSSMVAIDLACQHLQSGAVDMALAGGVTIYDQAAHFVAMTNIGMLSPTGKCRPFDAAADGTVVGDGAGLLVLKRRTDAERDGDRIYGVIKASGTNQDGRTSGLTVPSFTAQSQLEKDVYQAAKIDINEVQYVETHGTGTPLGDPIEIHALTDAFRQYTDAQGFCALGAVKANVGHTAAAAGALGVIKVLLAMQHEQLPPMANFQNANPEIDFANTPFYLPTRAQHWPVNNQGRRLAVASAFGFSGTNAHVVLESYPEPTEPSAIMTPPYPVVLSARTPQQLVEQARQLANALESQPQQIANVAYTLQTGRDHHAERFALVVSTLEELVAALEQFVAEPDAPTQGVRGQAQQSENALSLLEGDELATLIASWFANQRYDRIIALWAQGVNIDWSPLYQGRKLRRARLPGYSFAQQWRAPTAPDAQPMTHSAALTAPSQSDRIETATEQWQPAAPMTDEMAAFSPTHLLCLLSTTDNQLRAKEQIQAALPGCQVSFLGQQAIDPMQPDHLVNALQALDGSTDIDAVLYLWPLEDPACLEDLTRPLQVIQAMKHAGLAPKRMLLAGPFSDTRQRCFAEAWLGLERSLAIVMPSLQCAAVYQPVAMASSSALLDDWLPILLAELQVQDFQSTLYQQVQRYRLVQTHLRLPAVSQTMLRTHGCYLITGGCGGLGAMFADYLATTCQARLVLLGRSKPSKNQQNQLDHLTQAGAQAIYLQADVSDTAALQQALKQAKNQFGSIHGVIHAAGLESQSTLLERNVAQMQEAFSAKVDGTQLLDLLLADEALDFVCYFASSSAMFGDFGSCDYAMANRFQTAFAQHRNQQVANGERHGRTVAINWPLWDGGGMRPTSQAQLDLYLKTTGQRCLTAEDGLPLLTRLLQANCDHCLITAKAHAAMSVPEVASTPESLPAASARHTANIGTHVTDTVTHCIAELLEFPADELNENTLLADLGFDSISLVALSKKLSEHFQLDITPATFFRYPTVNALVAYLLENQEAAVHKLCDAAEAQSHEAKSSAATKTATRASSPNTRAPEKRQPTQKKIAVIGVSGRFPGADNLEAFWQMLVNGEDGVTEVPAKRWDISKYFHPTPGTAGKTCSKWAGLMTDIDKFDAGFFGLLAAEAQSMDPQQRILLEEAWYALESAGYRKDQLSDGQCGVFIGAAGTSEYSDLLKTAGSINSFSVLGGNSALLPARIAYFLNLKGPAMLLDTACSSSLVAIHQACQSIRNGESDMALAGGISLLLTPQAHVWGSSAGMLSPTGRCRAFDKSADGIVWGEAAAMLVLKDLDKAQQDGDPIVGVINGSLVNQDGLSNGMTAPNGEAQAQLIRTLYQQQDIHPESIQYVEAHGTGTHLGDPVEVKALTEAFTEQTQAKQFCAIGSVKTNIGHTAAASGITGLVKVLLALQHQQLPPSLHFTEENPYLGLADTPFYVIQQTQDWPRSAQDSPRRAAISAFGFSGTNAHLVIEEAPEQGKLLTSPDTPHAIILSARNQQALQHMAANLQDWLPAAEHSLAEIAHTLQVGRTAFGHRIAFIVTSRAQLAEKLQRYLSQGTADYEGQQTRAKPSSEQPCLPADANQLHDVLAGWVKGQLIDWHTLYPEGTKRIAMPGYAFQRRSYWVPTTSDNTDSNHSPTQMGFKPLNNVANHSRPPEHLGQQIESELTQFSQTIRLPFSEEPL